MPDESSFDRIQQEIDRRNSEDDSRALRQQLADDPETRGYFDDLTEITATLEGIPAAEAPARLREDVMRSVREHADLKADAAHRSSSRPTPSIMEHRRRRMIQFTVAIAAAAALVFLVDRSLFQRLDVANLRGSMLPATQTAQRVTIDAGSGGFITSEMSGRDVVLHFATASPASVEIRFDDRVLRIGGIDGAARIAAAGGTIRFELSGKEASARFRRETPAATGITVTLTRPGRPVSRTNIELPRSTNFSPSAL